jgi:D-xylose transport system permease protein
MSVVDPIAASTSTPAEAAPKPASSFSALGLLSSRSLRTTLILLLLWVFLAIHPHTREAFLSSENFSNLTAQVSELVIIGIGMTFVILIGGIDLSVGAGIALTGVVAAKMQIDLHQPAWVAVLAALAVGGAIGLWHGILVSRFKLPSFIATLAGLLAYRGIGLVLSHARGLSPLGDDFAVFGAPLPIVASMVIVGVALAVGIALVVSRDARRARFGLEAAGRTQLAITIIAMLAVAAFSAAIYQKGMPAPVLIAALATAFGAFLLYRTRLGRYAFAIGGNAEAARLSGVPVARTTILIYVMTGLLTAIAGVVAASRTNGVTPGNAGLTRELHVITAVVIGGTSLSGGRATIIGTVIGALIFGTLSNGMGQMDVDSNWQPILTGAILIGASLLDSSSLRKKGS